MYIKGTNEREKKPIEYPQCEHETMYVSQIEFSTNFEFDSISKAAHLHLESRVPLFSWCDVQRKHEKNVNDIVNVTLLLKNNNAFG